MDVWYFYFLFLLAVCIIGSIKEDIQNCENRKRYISKDGLTYLDNKSCSRLLSNNHVASYHTCNGEYVLKDVESHVILKNFTREKNTIENNEKRIAAIKLGRSTFRLSLDNYKTKPCVGGRFQDVVNSKVYVIRCLNEKHYYMDIETGFIVRETDYSLESLPHKEFDIDAFNSKQKKDKYYNYAWRSYADFREVCYKYNKSEAMEF